jgi:divalent metal cation (Fe/Co/Zn/Cd) transporter
MEKLAIDVGDAFFNGAHFLRSLTGLGKLVSILLSNAIVLAGLVFIIMLIKGGFQFISGSGSGDPQEVARGRQIIIAAIIGFIIVFASYWIVIFVGRTTGTNLLE